MARRRSKRLSIAAALWISLVFAGNAQATLIDFEDGTNWALVGDFYASLGVEFPNADWIMFDPALAGMSGTMGIYHTTLGNDFLQNNPVVLLFPDGVSRVSIDGIDIGANGLRMDAYDAPVGGALVDFEEVYGTGAGIGQYFTLEMQGPFIYRVELYQLLDTYGDGILFDNLDFDPRPSSSIPAMSGWSLATLALMMAGLGIAGFRRFR